MSAEPPITAELRSHETAALVEWDREALASLRSAAAEEEAGSLWRLAGGPDWQSAEALRVVSAAFDDGPLVALGALRPAGCEGHDAEAVVARLVTDGGDVVEVGRALLSTEYDEESAVRRAGIELELDEDAPPLRLAADRAALRERDGDGLFHQVAIMAARMDGQRGTCVYEILRRR